MENDNVLNIFDVEPEVNNDMDVQQPGDQFDISPNFDQTQEEGEEIDLTSEANFPINDFTNTPEEHSMDNSADKFEMQSTVSSYIPKNDGIFQESSFMIMDNDKSFNEDSLKSELNIRRTMAKIKKLGDGNTSFIKTEEKGKLS